MDIEGLIETVNREIKSGFVPPRALTSRLPFVTRYLRRRSFFDDHKHFPAFYYLGRALQPQSVLSMPLGWGLSTSCFLFGCKPEYVGVFYHQSGNNSTIRMAIHNVRRAYRKKLAFYDGRLNTKGVDSLLCSSKWDAVLIDEDMSYDDYLAYIRITWPHISDNGVLIINYVNYDNAAGRAYEDFCKTNHKPQLYVKSKFGLGLVFK